MFEDMEKDVFELADEDDSKEVKKKGRKSKKLQAEYESAFDGEEKAMHALSTIKSKIEREEKEIDVDSIIISPFKKSSRSDSIRGLTGLVKEWDVVSPIHVLEMEDDDCFQLLDGLRRVYAAVKSNRKTIKAVVWKFTDKREGKELANILSLMINRKQKFTPREMWEQMQILESVNEASPGLIEYLLQMDPGEAMKLKDVMLADNSYSEFRDGLLMGKYTIEQAYKKLCNERKKEDKLSKEDNLSVGSEGFVEKVGGSDGGPEGEVDDVNLSDSEVKEILEMTPSVSDLDDEDVTVEDMDKTDELRKDSMHQKVGERTFVDPSVKKAVLIRDENKCRCCGTGGAQWAGVLVYHHIIPVYAGGPDTVDNGLTLCVNCHLTLHNYITGDVQIPKDLDEEQAKIFKNIVYYGNKAIEASQKLGMKREDLKKANAQSKKHPMPNANVKINKEALQEAESIEKEQMKNSENIDFDSVVEEEYN